MGMGTTRFAVRGCVVSPPQAQLLTDVYLCDLGPRPASVTWGDSRCFVLEGCEDELGSHSEA